MASYDVFEPLFTSQFIGGEIVRLMPLMKHCLPGELLRSKSAGR